jgi:cytochrome c5
MRLPPPPALLVAGAAAAATILAAACASIPLPERDGVALYRAKCSGCHRPYAPQEIKPAKWQETFREMKKKAKLNDAEAETIRRYVEIDLIASHVPAAPVPR